VDQTARTKPAAERPRRAAGYDEVATVQFQYCPGWPSVIVGVGTGRVVVNLATFVETSSTLSQKWQEPHRAAAAPKKRRKRTGYKHERMHVSARGTFLLPSDLEGVKVRLRNPEGQYLSTDSNGWTFSADRARALVFDYLADQVEEYMKSVARVRGLVLKAMPVEPIEFLETCDVCHHMVATSTVFFDGGNFFCPRCWRKSSRTRPHS